MVPTRDVEQAPAREVYVSMPAQFAVECVLLVAILFALVLCYVKLDETNKDQKLLQIYFHQLKETVITTGEK